MAEYISMDCLWKCETCFYHRGGKCSTWCDAGESYRPAYSALKSFAIEAEPVKHGRWVECDDDDHLGDDYNHHKCTNCNTAAPYSYQYREDWDEGMDGEWYSLGIIDDGINEHLTHYCPNCGAKMDLEATDEQS